MDTVTNGNGKSHGSWMESAEAAKLLKRPVSAVRKMARKGQIKAKGKGRGKRYWLADIPVKKTEPMFDIATIAVIGWKAGRAGLDWNETLKFVRAISK